MLAREFNAGMLLYKHEQIRAGVHTQCCVSIFPLLGRYEFSFGQPDAFRRQSWRGFSAIRWSAEFDSQAKICDFFLQQNFRHMTAENCHLISFCHFIIGLDMMPEAISVHHRKGYPILGSARLDCQDRRLQPAQIYCRSYVDQTIELDRKRYVNNAFANPAETRITRKALVRLFDTEALPSVSARENQRESA